ncbi:MAG: excinuclease ABC subunit UvrC, partial [Syntrophales bacterium]|nr:excinuclease ABC subunit UvrC [Syntrophales bacterium]
MKDADGKVIYAGKAKDLESRTRAYLNRTDKRCMTPFLTSRIAAVEFIVTKTEKEALILENNLIKEHRPKYNVNLRDDKTYFSISIDLKQVFPRFQLVRQVKKDGARYFGPYPSSSAAKETLHFIQPIFPLRTCGDGELKNRSRPCLEYQIGRCVAPCAGFVDKYVYDAMVQDAIAFLEGKEKGLLTDLSSRMKTAAERLRFEEAAILRDKISAIEKTLEKQQMVSTTFKDQDVFGLYREGNQAQVCLLNVVQGKLLGKISFPLITLPAASEEILSSLIVQYYDGNVCTPGEIILPCRLKDKAVIAEWLTEKKGRSVTLHAPQKGRSMDLLMMANRNAENAFVAERQDEGNIEKAIALLAEKLQLKNMPERMECFDISNVSGKYAVGSLVTFTGGRPAKEGYRRFRIKTIPDMDDYGMMREVLRRRYEKKGNLPDLVVVDGGRGQMGVAVALLKDLEITGVDVIGFAKEDRTSPPVSLNRKEDRVYLPGRKEPVYLSRCPQALFLLQRLRDEAHRFALFYHRKLKEKQDFHSLLDEIPGIGKARKKDLLAHFGDIKKITSASIEDLQKVKGIG